MRVAILHPYLDKPRGAEQQVAHYTAYLLSRGHDVAIFTFEYRPESFLYNNLIKGATVVEISPRWKGHWDLFSGQRASQLIPIIAASAPHFRRLEQYDVINPHNHPMEWVSAFLTKPVVWTCNEPPMWEYYPSPSYRWAQRIHRRLSRRVDRTLILDAGIRDVLVAFPHYRNVTIVGSGAELYRPVKHEENDVLDVLYVGPLHPQKRPMDVVGVCASLRRQGYDVVLHIVGEDLTGGRLTEEISRSPVPTRLHGHVSVESLYRLYDLADLALYLPERQPWGIFPLEAALAGIPTLVSDECGFLGHLGDAWPFPVSPTGRMPEATKAAANLVANLPAWRAAARRAGLRLTKLLSWVEVGKRVESIFIEEIEMFGTENNRRVH